MLEFLALATILTALAASAAGTVPAVPPDVLRRAKALADAWEQWDGRPGTFQAPEGVGPLLGRGQTRAVFRIGDFAVKVPSVPDVVRRHARALGTNPGHALSPRRGVENVYAENSYAEFNQREAETWEMAPPELRPLLLPVLAADPDGRWLVMPLAERVPMAESRAFCAALDKEFSQVLSDCGHPANIGRYQGRLALLDYPDDISDLVLPQILPSWTDVRARLVESGWEDEDEFTFLADDLEGGEPDRNQAWRSTRARYEEFLAVIPHAAWVAIYRKLAAKNLASIDRSNLGIFWSYDPESAEAYWGGKGQIFLLFAEVRITDVDWMASVLANVRLPGEHEIALKDGVPIQLIGIEDARGKMVFEGSVLATSSSGEED